MASFSGRVGGAEPHYNVRSLQLVKASLLKRGDHVWAKIKNQLWAGVVECVFRKSIRISVKLLAEQGMAKRGKIRVSSDSLGLFQVGEAVFRLTGCLVMVDCAPYSQEQSNGESTVLNIEYSPASIMMGAMGPIMLFLET